MIIACYICQGKAASTSREFRARCILPVLGLTVLGLNPVCRSAMREAEQAIRRGVGNCGTFGHGVPDSLARNSRSEPLCTTDCDPQEPAPSRFCNVDEKPTAPMLKSDSPKIDTSMAKKEVLRVMSAAINGMTAAARAHLRSLDAAECHALFERADADARRRCT